MSPPELSVIDQLYPFAGVACVRLGRLGLRHPAAAAVRRAARARQALAGDARQESAAVADPPLQGVEVDVGGDDEGQAELLLRRIDNVEADGEFVVCPTNLIRRGSA